MRVCTKCRRIAPWQEGDDCVKCGTVLKRAPYKWSPPKHNNKRAWKRIEKGEWLWDRRRLRRNPRRMGASYERLPNHKKGQSIWGTWPVPRSKGADVDMGG